MAALSEREARVVRQHVAAAGDADGARVVQWHGASSVLRDGRLWVHRDNGRRQAMQELFFHAVWSVANTLTCSHTLKFWDLRRHATPRETARLQGFPDAFVLPRARYNRLLANAVAVPCARFACSRVCDAACRTMVDLCAGVGGFAFAARGACPGIRCVGFSEVLPAASECYRDNFPGVRALGDARAVSVWPRCDLLTCGFPCQPFSSCLSRARRSGHTQRDFYRVVLDAVRETGASRVVLENVPAFQTTGRAQWDALCAELRAMGFALDAAVLDARDFGLPQARRRLYLVGARRGRPQPLAAYEPTPRTTLASLLE